MKYQLSVPVSGDRLIARSRLELSSPARRAADNWPKAALHNLKRCHFFQRFRKAAAGRLNRTASGAQSSSRRPHPFRS